MQDNWDNLDLQMKAMLENAEVKAPRSVWRGVSKSLDAAAGPAFAGAWIAWGSAFAAAAIAAALVIPRFFGNDPVEAPVALVDNPAPVEIPAVPVEDTTVLVPVSRALLADAVEVIPAEDAPVAPAEENEAETVLAPETPSGESKPESTYDAEQVRRYWAQVAQESKSKEEIAEIRRKPSFYAGGFIGTNDSGFAANNGRSLMSPSYGPGQSIDGLTETSASTYGIPFSVGLGVRIPLFDRVSVGTGIDYSLLERTFTGNYVNSGTSVTGDVAHRMQYLGIPCNIYFDILDARQSKAPIHFYSYVGGEVETCISNKYIIRQAGAVVDGRLDGLQWSVAAGLGVEFNIAGPLNLYVDPSVRYYFYNGQPKNLRTEKPFMVSFDAGFRINL